MNLSIKNGDGEGGIIFFDDECPLCQASVRFIRARDKRHFFRFCPQQSPEGHDRLQALGLDPSAPASLVYWDGARAHQRSDAALRIARHLSGLWPVLTVMLALPRWLRDPVYNVVARNRYRWFGRV
jgi:predicted DCC family thiol-disulfide oxidoreductase YuxK